MRLRAEHLILCLLVLAAGVGASLAVVGCGDDEKGDNGEPVATATEPQTAPPPETETTPAPVETTAPEDEIIVVKLDEEEKEVRVGLIDSDYCEERLELCAAIEGKDNLALLTKSQVKVIRNARATLQAQEEAAQEPVPVPEPAPVPEPVPQPAPTT